MDAYLDELAGLLRIPSLSADPAHAADVVSAGEWVRDFVRAAGGGAEIVDWKGRPLMIGEISASKDADSAPTVISYGHFDVQPPAPLELWESPPFEPTVRGEWLYGRGVADDKGQLYMQLKAAAELAQAGALPVNVRFCCDGEEEIGGQSIVEFLREDERGGDACVIFDSHMLGRMIPVFCVATRGLVYFHVRCRTGDRDLHSGVFGGAAQNAAHALMKVLDSVQATDGRFPDELRAGAVPPSEAERESWRTLQPGADVLAEQGARPMDAEAAAEFYLRTWSEPSVDVNGIEGGSPILHKTVLPVFAEANVSIRLAPGQDPGPIAESFERLLRAATPPGAEIDIERDSASAPGLVDADAKAIRLGLDAFERALGVRPLLIRSGGTLPIVPALTERGIPTVITGFDVPEGNIHSPNERLLLEYLPLGVAAARELYLSFAGLR